MSEPGLWAVFGAVATVQIMEMGMCGREVAALAFQETTQKYVGDELTTEQLTDIVLESVELVRRRNPFLLGSES